MRMQLVLGLALSAVSGCADEVSTTPGGDGGAGAAQAGGAGGDGQGAGGVTASGGGGAGSSVEYCDVGAPYVEPEASLSGTIVTLWGTTRRAPNIVQVGSADCTEGLNAALLETIDTDTDVLIKSGGETVFCGCAGEQHALCLELGENAGRLVTGELLYAENGMCNQVPCYEIEVQSLCKPSTP